MDITTNTTMDITTNTAIEKFFGSLYFGLIGSTIGGIIGGSVTSFSLYPLTNNSPPSDMKSGAQMAFMIILTETIIVSACIGGITGIIYGCIML
jgi:hypothetical protein